MGKAGMRLMPRHRDVIRCDALVPVDHLHIGRLADDYGGGTREGGGDAIDHRRSAETTDLFIVG